MKKLILASIFLLVVVMTSYGQLFYPFGSGTIGGANVGINTASPSSTLHVLGSDVHFRGNNFRTGDNNSIGGSLFSGSMGFMNQVSSSDFCFALGSSNIINVSEHSATLGEQNNIVNGYGSIALGGQNNLNGGYTIGIGSGLQVIGTQNIALGSDLTNNINKSLMIGFNSNLPTLTVRQASGMGTTGNVGIGTSNPLEKLHVDGTIRASSLAGGGNICSDATGNLYISGPCGGGGGDDLGSHIATTNLDMQCNDVVNSGNIMFCNGSFLDQIGPNELMLQGALQIQGPAGMTGFELFVNGQGNATGGWWTISDKRYKKDIQQITSAGELVQQINGYSYAFQKEGFEDMKLPGGKNYGFLAQEIQAVLPEAVSETPNGMLAVNYDMVLPLLTEAIKEQQATIETQSMETEKLKAEITALKDAVKSICNDGCGTMGKIEGNNDQAPSYWEEVILEQNAPNPFNTITNIKYYLPKDVKEASLLIYDLQGKQIKKFDQLNTGHGSIEISAGTLEGGMYLYGLLIDGKASTTMKMILTK